jgi:3-hydroxyisobutyrate dehydrogenase-like beta-hydroxyacid dehydrogenase
MEERPMNPNITVLGTGRMGSALARAFLRQKYSTAVWNRTASSLAPLLALGARAATAVLDAVSGSDIIIVNVNDYASGDTLLKQDGVAQALAGKLLVQFSSGSPKQAREMGAWAAKHGIRYLDGAIMATPDLIGGPQSTILYAGDADAFEQYKSELLTLGANGVHDGTDPGLASALDSALLMVMWGALFGTLQGVAICKAERLELSAYANYLAPFLQAMSGWSLDVVKRIDEGRLSGDAETVASVDTHYGAFRCLMELCKDRNIHHVLPEAMEPVFRAALHGGHARDDFAILSRFMK